MRYKIFTSHLAPATCHLALFTFIVLLTLTSCQKFDFSTIEESTSDEAVSVSFRICQIEQIPFENTQTRSTTVLDSLCSRISLAIFQGETRVKVINQTSAEADFGTITLSLTPGTYQVVAIAHNGLGNCSITSTDKVTFQNNKVTDTFYYCGAITITEACTQPLTLTRPVAMFRLRTTEPVPEGVVQMQFSYTGGSSTFNPTSGYGCVNSKQSESFDVTPDMYGHTATWEIYTFPHEANDFLTIKATAIDTLGATVAEESYSNIYVQPNVITQHTCSFFSATPDSAAVTSSVIIQDDGRWSDLISQ